MATVYYATNATGLTVLQAQAIQEPNGYDIIVPFSFATAGLSTPHVLAADDSIQLAKIPKGAVILDWYFYVPELEASGAQLTLDLGLLYTGASAFLLNSTVGRSAGIVSPLVAATNGLVANALPSAEVNVAVATSADGSDVFQLSAPAASNNAGTGGTLKGWVRYIWRPTVF